MQARIPALAVILAALSGCLPSALDEARRDFYRRDPAAAEARLAPLAAGHGRNELLYALERGTALHQMGRYEESSQEFLKAAERIRDLETKSVSKEAAGFAYSDIARDYAGEIHERLLVHTYLMMNYFLLGQETDALVEARRSVKILDEEGRPPYAEDPFTRFLAAIAFDIRGADDDAYIELKKIARLAPAFPYAKAPLARTARKTGRTKDLARWQELPGPDTDFSQVQGMLVAFVEMGRSPVKEQRELFIPPAYRFVVPQYVPCPSENGAAVLVSGDRKARSFLLTDVQGTAIKTLQDRMAKETAKETARQALGEGVAQVIKKNEGDFLALLWRLFFAATRTTDTRSWETLPGTLQIAMLPLPAGTHDAVIRFTPAGAGALLGPAGAASSSNEIKFPGLMIRAGRYTFVNARGF